MHSHTVGRENHPAEARRSAQAGGSSALAPAPTQVSLTAWGGGHLSPLVVPLLWPHSLTQYWGALWPGPASAIWSLCVSGLPELSVFFPIFMLLVELLPLPAMSSLAPVPGESNISLGTLLL